MLADKNIKVPLWLIAFIILLLMMITCTGQKKWNKLQQETNLYKTLMEDSLIQFRDKNKLLSFKSQVLEASNSKQILEIKSQKKTITMLQSEVAQYKSKLSNSTAFSSQTKFDTVLVTQIKYVYDTVYQDGDTILIPKTIHSVKHKDAWVDIDIQSDSMDTHIGIQIENEYTVSLVKNKKKWEAIVKNRNPYSTVKEITAVKLGGVPKPKKFGVGFHLGYGVNSSFKLNPYIGIGVSYNVISF